MTSSPKVCVVGKMSVCVVVLGDIGRSPRMQYQCVSLAKHYSAVDLIAYAGHRGCEEFESCFRIRKSFIKPAPHFSYLPRVLSYAAKTIWMTVVLFYTLLMIRKPQHILVQNPPSIPTLFVAWFYSLMSGSKLVIDWHNYGYSILSLTMQVRHPLVRICYWIEGYFGRRAHHHFCVSKAMQEDLRLKWAIEATVLYDKPPKHFKKVEFVEKHNIIHKLKLEYPILADQDSEEQTIISSRNSKTNEIVPKSSRPALIISSTSWTEDEDFSILLAALDIYEERCLKNKHLPNLLCFITGKGPLKEFYSTLIQNKIWRHITVLLPWLEPEDYPRLLAACDLGICLHKSSSKLDLPMKILDMFGCAVPVCAFRYHALTELVKEDENGLLFGDSEELVSHLCLLLRKGKREKLNKFSQNLQQEYREECRWDQNWNENALNKFLP